MNDSLFSNKTIFKIFPVDSNYLFFFLVSNFPILKKEDGRFIQGTDNILQHFQETVSFQFLR